jgi:transcriptional regulator with XRE-family HTH domain
MATEKIKRDPTSERVARNLAELREARGLTLRDLHVRLRDVGRPILPSGLHKIERGDRRVDVDDLVALAVALDVTPTRLLMPATATRKQMQLTPKVRGSERTVWAWAAGDEALRDLWRRDTGFDLERAMRFRLENRPDDPSSGVDFREMHKHVDVLVPLTQAFNSARESGLPTKALIEHLQLNQTMRAFVEGAQAKAKAKGKG